MYQSVQIMMDKIIPNIDIIMHLDFIRFDENVILNCGYHTWYQWQNSDHSACQNTHIGEYIIK